MERVSPQDRGRKGIVGEIYLFELEVRKTIDAATYYKRLFCVYAEGHFVWNCKRWMVDTKFSENFKRIRSLVTHDAHVAEIPQKI